MGGLAATTPFNPKSSERAYDIVLPSQGSAFRLSDEYATQDIRLTEQQERWIKAQIATGHLGNDIEYIRGPIRRDPQVKERIDTLRQALINGEASGRARALDMSAVKKSARLRATTAS